CGLFQGRRSEMYEKNQNLPFDPSEIDAMILSHAHLDHSGNIPNLIKNGFKGKIFATEPTVDLCKILLRDSAYLQEQDIRWVNVARAKSNDKPPVKPIYSIKEAQAAMNSFHPVQYDERFEILKGVKVTFRDAGHILGSAGILLEIREKGRAIRLGFTGDLGRKDTVVICDPNPIRDLDALICETTYGNRFHSPQADIEEELASVINQVAIEGGKILIPSFAVGRTQQVVYYLHKLFSQDRIHDMPIFVDSPMANRATEVFRKYPQYLDREANRIFLDNNEDPFGFKRLTYVNDTEDSKKLNDLIYPHIIISASGMAEGGRILHHLRNNIENSKTLILFVGYSAKETLARKIMDGQKKVKIYGEEFTVNAKIKILDHFSAHADRRGILDYFKFSTPERLKNIFLVHGEPDQAESLIDALRSQGFQNVHYPKFKDSFEI
ncbi:MAG: MBL fold metallo-hydrolase, partial [Deltaproteobacteria bacterium]|nr:MBL fold metallo-hydrolase [Deltaproteobacteria bacterium]